MIKLILTWISSFTAPKFSATICLRFKSEMSQIFTQRTRTPHQSLSDPNCLKSHGHRPSTYSPTAYVQEFGNAVQVMSENPDIGTPKNLLGPSLSGLWTPEVVWATPFLSQYSSNLAAITFEQYVAETHKISRSQPGF
jgi:hypothetical protein